MDFWSFAKYPPDLPFLASALAATFAGLAAIWWMTRSGTPVLLRPFVVFGRVPFFFCVVHFYVLGLAAAVVRTKFGLLETYLVWLLLLGLMIGPCTWYYRKKRDRGDALLLIVRSTLRRRYPISSAALGAVQGPIGTVQQR